MSMMVSVAVIAVVFTLLTRKAKEQIA